MGLHFENVMSKIARGDTKKKSTGTPVSLLQTVCTCQKERYIIQVTLP